MTQILLFCKYTDYFTWRSTNNACHCVMEDNCDTPQPNNGLNIYEVVDCSSINLKSQFWPYFVVNSPFLHNTLLWDFFFPINSNDGQKTCFLCVIKGL